MWNQRRWFIALSFAILVTMRFIPVASEQDGEALAYHRQAKINWRGEFSVIMTGPDAELAIRSAGLDRPAVRGLTMGAVR